jgi:predicted GIY-YIG superfamily endonuclease
MTTTTDYIYVLCFRERIHHAKHYTGSTVALLGRLKQHALGKGSKLTQKLVELDITWEVSAIYAAKEGFNVREIEARMKRAKNGPRHCPNCQPACLAPEGTIAIPDDARLMIGSYICQCARAAEQRWSTQMAIPPGTIWTRAMDDDVNPTIEAPTLAETFALDPIAAKEYDEHYHHLQ